MANSEFYHNYKIVLEVFQELESQYEYGHGRG